jgi:hypothetical protein
MNPTAVVRPLPGPGLAARAGDLLLVCADSAGATDGVEELLALVTEVSSGGGDGSVLVRRVAALLAADFAGRYPACAAAGPTSDGRVAVLVNGTATAEVAGGDGHVRLTAADAIGSVTRLVAGPVTAVRLQLPGAGDAHPRVRLDGGVVPAAGLVRSEDDAAGPGSSTVEPALPGFYLPPSADLAPPGYVAPSSYAASYEAPAYEAPASYEAPAYSAAAYVPPVSDAPAYPPPAFEPPSAYEPPAYVPPPAYGDPAQGDPARGEPAFAQTSVAPEPEPPAPAEQPRRGFGSAFRKLGKDAASAFGDSLKDAAAGSLKDAVAGSLKDAASSAIGDAASNLAQNAVQNLAGNAVGSLGDAAASALGDAASSAVGNAASSLADSAGSAVGDAAASALGDAARSAFGRFGGNAELPFRDPGAAVDPAAPVADWRAVTPPPGPGLQGIGEHGEPVVVVPAIPPVPSMRVPSPPEAVAPPMRHPDPNAPFV